MLTFLFDPPEACIYSSGFGVIKITGKLAIGATALVSVEQIFFIQEVI